MRSCTQCPSLAPRGTLCRCVSLVRPSPAPHRNSSRGEQPQLSMELSSPVKENALQAKHLERRTHQPITLRFAGATCNRGLSFAVRADGTVTQHQRTTRNTFPGSDTACMVCITPGLDSCGMLLPLELPNQTRTNSEKTSQSLQSHVIQVRRLLHLACQIPALDLYIKSVTGDILCTHGVRTIQIRRFFVDRNLSFNVTEFFCDSKCRN